ncbi:MAG: hypothetical protein AB1508_07120 [Pseudomonadota bacterium]
MVGDALEKRLDERLRDGALNSAVELGEAGLVFGAGTLLAPMRRDDTGAPRLDLDADGARVFALLAAAYGRPVRSDVLKHIKGASEHWRNGDKALANIRLAFARLPRLEDRASLYRLLCAEDLLEQGLAPRVLLRAMGFDSERSGLAKYDPAEQRVPQGNGRPSGRWTSGGAGTADAKPAVSRPPDSKPAIVSRPASIAAPAAAGSAGAAELGTLAEGLFAKPDNLRFLAGLTRLASLVGRATPLAAAATVLGTIFVPIQKNPFVEGPIPGDSGLRYSLDNDEGVLHFLDAHSGAEVAAARRGRDGIFFETETGIPVARMVGGSVVFDAAILANEAEDSRAQSGTKTSADTNTNTPQLCPDPGPDVPHGASPRSIAYQAHVSAMNNPQRPLPPGLAVSLIDTKTGKRVVFDDCRESDGVMIEAKGPGFARLLRYAFFSKEILPRRWRNQADRQVSAAGERQIEWFFAEPEAAEKAEEIFRDGSDRFKKIKVRYEPALVS